MRRNILLVVELRIVLAESCLDDESESLQSKIIAIAINIMSTWWYPRNGISPDGTVSQIPVQSKNVTLTHPAN